MGALGFCVANMKPWCLKLTISPMMGSHLLRNSLVPAGATNRTPLGLWNEMWGGCFGEWVSKWALRIEMKEGRGKGFTVHIPIEIDSVCQQFLLHHLEISDWEQFVSPEGHLLCQQWRETYLVFEESSRSSRRIKRLRISKDDSFSPSFNDILEDLLQMFHISTLNGWCHIQPWGFLLFISFSKSFLFCWDCFFQNDCYIKGKSEGDGNLKGCVVLDRFLHDSVCQIPWT